MSIGSRLWHVVVGGLLRSISPFSRRPAPTTKRCLVCRAEAARSVNELLVNVGGSTLTMTIGGWWCGGCSVLDVTGHSPTGSRLIGYVQPPTT